jgi:uncharacterized protein YjbI with pentapeptide repeats
MDRTYLSGDEFVRKLLEGEKDFRVVNVEDGLDLTAHEAHEEIRLALKEEYGGGHEGEPLLIGTSSFRQLKAPGLDLCFRGKSADLTGAIFAGASLHKTVFEAVHLEGADLSNVRAYWVPFSQVYAEGANFSGAGLMGAGFFQASLKKVNFRDARLSGAWFKYANCNGADFRKADLGEANFNRAKLTGAQNLGEAKNLETATFLHTAADGPVRESILNAMQQRPYFK